MAQNAHPNRTRAGRPRGRVSCQFHGRRAASHCAGPCGVRGNRRRTRPGHSVGSPSHVHTQHCSGCPQRDRRVDRVAPTAGGCPNCRRNCRRPRLTSGARLDGKGHVAPAGADGAVAACRRTSTCPAGMCSAKYRAATGFPESSFCGNLIALALEMLVLVPFLVLAWTVWSKRTLAGY